MADITPQQVDPAQWRAAADALDAMFGQHPYQTAAADAIDAAFTGPCLDRQARYAADYLRREADQAEQETQARPPKAEYLIEVYDDGDWVIPSATTCLDCARKMLAEHRAEHPDKLARITRAVTTWALVDVAACNCDAGGPEFVPAGHYADCPEAGRPGVGITDPQVGAVGTIGGMDSSDTTRLRDLESEAFRTGRTLADHTQQLTDIREAQATAFGNIDSIGNAIGNVDGRSIAERLDGLDEHLTRTDGRLDHIEGRLDTLGANVAEILALLRSK